MAAVVDLQRTEPPTNTGHGPTPTEVVCALLAAVAVGLFVRALPVARADFPLHDGGMFYVMAEDLRANSFALPAFTSYNGGILPFSYPPLAVYIAAALNVAGVPLTAVFHWVPLVFSVASIPLVFMAARALTGERHAIVAAFAFALMPSSYDWMIVGGGLTRGLGLCLGIVAIWQVARLIERPTPKRAVIFGIASGLTVLSHPYAAAFTALSVTLVLVWRARQPAQYLMAALAALIALVIAMPWAATVVAQHGFEPLLAGGGSRSNVWVSAASLLSLDVTGATFSVFLGIALVGFTLLVAQRRWLIPVWILLTFTLLASGGWVMSMLPMSLLIGVAVVDGIIPAISRLTGGKSAVMPAFVVLLPAGLIASLGVGLVVVTPVWPLSADQRQAMEWVRTETPAGATFAVLTGQGWALDTASEWFPALTKRVSLGTAQGYEWTSDWSNRVNEAIELQACAGAISVSCLEAWAGDVGQHPKYVYVAKGPQLGPRSSSDCCAAIRQDLAAHFSVVYDGPGATIFVWRDG